MAQAQRLLLAQEHRIAGRQARPFERRKILAALALGDLAFEGDVEIILDRALAASGDEDHLLDPGLARFIHGILDQRTVDHGQQLLGHRLGGGQETRAKAGDRKDGFANRFVRHGTPFSMSAGSLGGSRTGRKRSSATATCLYGSDRQKTLCNLFQRRNFIIQMLQAYILSIVT